MTDEEKYYLDSLISKALTVTTDEVEGQLTIDLNALDLCAVDYGADETGDVSVSDQEVLQNIYADKDLWKLLSSDPADLPEVIKDIDTNDNVIIEFSEATIKDPNPVRYSIYVNPGDAITEETIIGEVMQNGEMKQIKSIFQKGTVQGINDNTDYFRLYPSRCDRHIVLNNTLYGNGSDFDIHEQIEEVNDKFKNEGYLYALITNNMCQSLLPYVLSHRYRGVYTRTYDILSNTYGRWYLDTSDLSYDNMEVSTFIENDEFLGNQQYNTSLFIYDTVNDSLATGPAIFDTSIMQPYNELQNNFGAHIIDDDLDPDQIKSWKKRAKKKKNRKKVKKEIQKKTDEHTNKFKTSDNPYNAVNDEGTRLLKIRQEYIDSIIELYESRDKLPLCKYDPEYADCQFLTNNDIDEDVLDNAKEFDGDFSYDSVGDSDEYYNYYTSLLSHINLQSNDDDLYSKEYYDLITDIINKRLIVEGKDYKTIIVEFMNLFNDNVKDIFNISSKSTDTYIINLFNQFEIQVNKFVLQKNKEYKTDITNKFTELNLDDEAISNAGTKYSDQNKYQQIYDYINSLYTMDKDEDEDCANEVIALLTTMYMYIKSYGGDENNKYKDIDIDKEYLYLGLVLEEALKLTEFWDKVIKVYKECTMDNCTEALNTLAHSLDTYAIWPDPTEITINDVTYKHYLFENIYPTDSSTPIDISIGNYSFPESVDFPEIPDSIDVNEDEALNDLMNPVQQDPDDPNAVTFKDFLYWQKYFALATLISLPFFNCGLDLMPYIQLIQLPCIFIAINCVYIPIFNLLIVFGIAIRGMYPWPIILYLNTSNEPVSVLTPLVAVLDLLKQVFYNKLDLIEQAPIQNIVNTYIKKLNTENNNLKKENIKLSNFETVIKGMKIPNATSIQEDFAKIVDPSVDTRHNILRIETLAKKSRV